MNVRSHGSRCDDVEFDAVDQKHVRSAKVHIDMFTDSAHMASIGEYSWDVIALVARKYWLLVEWKGSTAYRIGWIWIPRLGPGSLANEATIEADLLGDVKTIRLG